MNFKKIYESSITFEELLIKNLDDLLELCDAIDICYFDDKLIENVEAENKKQIGLQNNIQERIENLKFDIELVKSKTSKGTLPDIDTQNYKLFDLYERVYIILKRFNRLEKAENKTIELKEEMISLIKEFEVNVELYNKKARNRHEKTLHLKKLKKEAYESVIDSSNIKQNIEEN